MKKIPDNFTDFLYWIKEQTELFWSKDLNTPGNDPACKDWIIGAKWLGLAEKQIDEIEVKYSISFTSEHREFLKILHTIDRKETITYTGTFDDKEEIKSYQIPFFYNWLTDENEIRERFKWPYQTILEDILGPNQVWLKSWGTRPSNETEAIQVYSDWFKKTPTLIPLYSHRFLISDKELEHRPVLSVYGSDIIVYGWDLRSYLLNELGGYLDIWKEVYDSGDDCYYHEWIDEVAEIFNRDLTFDKNRIIPYWQEMILIWSSGWSSFGLKYPRENDSAIQPITKTYVPEGESTDQKRFNDFK